MARMFVELVRLDGDRLTDQGDLDLAWRRYAAGLRILDHLRNGGGAGFLEDTTVPEELLGESIVQWSGAAGQSEARLQAALVEFQSLRGGPPPVEDVLRADYVRRSGHFEEEWEGQKQENPVAWLLLTAERERWRRFHDYFTRRYYESWRQVVETWSQGVATAPQMFHYLPGERDWLDDTLAVSDYPDYDVEFISEPERLFDAVLRQEKSRRTTQIRLAIAIWRQRQARRPRRLTNWRRRFWRKSLSTPLKESRFSTIPKAGRSICSIP